MPSSECDIQTILNTAYANVDLEGPRKLFIVSNVDISKAVHKPNSCKHNGNNIWSSDIFIHAPPQLNTKLATHFTAAIKWHLAYHIIYFYARWYDYSRSQT
jgi:hypothetical protein